MKDFSLNELMNSTKANKTNLEHYSNCCGAYMNDWPDSPLCPECKEHCGAYLAEDVLRAVRCHKDLLEALEALYKSTINLAPDNMAYIMAKNHPLTLAKAAITKAQGGA